MLYEVITFEDHQVGVEDRGITLREALGHLLLQVDGLDAGLLEGAVEPLQLLVDVEPLLVQSPLPEAILAAAIRQSVAEVVITSYSIHYTKLYETVRHTRAASEDELVALAVRHNEAGRLYSYNFV